MIRPKSPSKQAPSSQDDDKITKQNIEDLARIIASEARGSNETAQTMVGWTVVNRMKKHHFKMVSSVWANHRYAHGYPPTTTSRRIASAILTGKEKNNIQGAVFFYSPLIMPKEGDKNLSRYDIKGGLETVDGVRRNGKPVKNYAPGWAVPERRVLTPDIPECTFKFYKE